MAEVFLLSVLKQVTATSSSLFKLVVVGARVVVVEVLVVVVEVLVVVVEVLMFGATVPDELSIELLSELDIVLPLEVNAITATTT